MVKHLCGETAWKVTPGLAATDISYRPDISYKIDGVLRTAVASRALVWHMHRRELGKEAPLRAMRFESMSTAGRAAASRAGWRRTVALVAATSSTVLGGCSNGSADQVTRPAAVGMTSQMAPFYTDGNLTLYEAQIPVPLPVRKPAGGEGQGAPPAGTPYPHAPFLRVEDEAIEVHYTLSNVDDTSHDAWLLIDPWNEFVRWRPGVTVVSADQTIPNFGYDLGFVIPARSRIQGTLTVDDMHEMAIKLAAVEMVGEPASPARYPDGGQRIRCDVDRQPYLRSTEPLELGRPTLHTVDSARRCRHHRLRPRRANASTGKHRRGDHDRSTRPERPSLRASRIWRSAWPPGRCSLTTVGALLVGVC